MNTSDSLRVLVIGSGGREHALVSTLSESPRLDAIWCSPGNGGIASMAQCVALEDASAMIAFCREQSVDLVVIGPEQPLVDGVSDALRAAGVTVFAPSQAAAQLEASKAFTKSVCDEGGIPTAAYGAFENEADALAYLKGHSMPVVIKADGLAAGKGVVIAQEPGEAQHVIAEMFAGKFGEASRRVVIEEYLRGEELSFFALCDGLRAVPFGSAQDHKAAYDGDKGPNTGGMGTYSPAPIVNEALEQRIMEEIIRPALAVMAARGTPYQGILFAGLMIDHGAPKLIEFNARLGDPETQVILPRLNEDLLSLLYDAARGALPERPLAFRSYAAVCVVMAARGYPGVYEKGSEIKGLDSADAMEGVRIFHAGTRRDGRRIFASGGRVLGVTALGRDVREAQKRAYTAVDAIDWPEGFCRRDIAWRALAS